MSARSFFGRGGAKRFRKRYDVINYFVRRGAFRSYLEIGTSTGRCLERVECLRKVGVDPAPRAEGVDWVLHKKTSDAFFAETDERFDIVFIDGLHLAEQVLKDIFNSLSVLQPRGVVLLHDCNPESEAAQLRDEELVDVGVWNGDVWKVIAWVRREVPSLFCRVIDVDGGIGVVIPREGSSPPPYDDALRARAEDAVRNLRWEDLEANRDEALGLLDGRAALERELASVWHPAAETRG